MMLVLVGVALCGESACNYFSRDQQLIATRLTGLCVFLVLPYVLWAAVNVATFIGGVNGEENWVVDSKLKENLNNNKINNRRL